MTNRYALGIDYGTNSCRSLLVDIATGEELGSSVFAYASGEMGILTDPRDPNVARQRPQDYVDGLIAVNRLLWIAKAPESGPEPTIWITCSPAFSCEGNVSASIGHMVPAA